jgi:hypothetical protein
MVARRVLGALALLTLVFVLRPVLVQPVMACSCAMDPDPIRTGAGDPSTAVFTGVVQAPEAAGTPVVLTRWFKGTAAGPIVALDNGGFEDPFGGSCGTSRPPAGSEWLFVSGLTERGLFGVGLCSTHADLATPEGQALLATATTVLGPGTLRPAEPEPPPFDAEPEGISANTVALVVAAAIGGLGIAVGAAAVLWRRRPA